ncbi:MAG: polyprenyl synthetase family protein [Methanotrichaceae archaeon]|nr:polyprenyl synthetase family protein [Methanotrichaceae archaeon]
MAIDLGDLERRAAIVSLAIGELLPVQRPEQLYRAGRHLLDAGGKRLRPSMLLMASEAVGGNPLDVVPAAVAIELVHNFTLIHDDIMDNADLRRGKPAVHVLWGTSGAILAGDTLYSKAFQILSGAKADPGKVLSSMGMLSQTCASICEGQWMDLDFEGRDEVFEAEYMEMIEKKTGVLYGASAWIGAMLSGGSQEEVAGLEEYGRLTGMGFQIHDDILDLTVPAEVLGKRRGGDLVEGKKTLIMIHAMDRGVRLDLFGRGKATVGEIEDAISLLDDSGSIEYARAKAIDLVDRGKEALGVLKDSTVKALLLDLADYMIRRGY